MVFLAAWSCLQIYAPSRQRAEYLAEKYKLKIGLGIVRNLWLSKVVLGKQIYARQVVEGAGSALLALAEALYRSTVRHGQT